MTRHISFTAPKTDPHLLVSQLWDVIEDQEAVDLIRDVQDAQAASEQLLKHALSEFSTDNTSVMVVRFASA